MHLIENVNGGCALLIHTHLHGHYRWHFLVRYAFLSPMGGCAAAQEAKAKTTTITLAPGSQAMV